MEAGASQGAAAVQDAPDDIDRDQDEERRLRLVTVPGALRGATFGVTAHAVRGLLLVAVVAALVLWGRWWWVQHQATALPMVDEGLRQAGQQLGAGEDPASGVAPVADGAGTTPTGAVPGEGGPASDGEAGGVPSSGSAGRPSPQAGEAEAGVLVHVIGEVREPGVVELAVGARVVDAVDAAGGFTGEADTSSVNLARVVADGEQLWVGAPGEQPPEGLVEPGATPGAEGGAGAGSGPGSATSAGLVDLNTATRETLETLPGVGPVTAEKILAWRDEHGSFTAVDELLEVSGIGERTLEELAPLVTVGG